MMPEGSDKHQKAGSRQAPRRRPPGGTVEVRPVKLPSGTLQLVDKLEPRDKSTYYETRPSSGGPTLQLGG